MTSGTVYKGHKGMQQINGQSSERLSALLDGELSAQELDALLQEFENSPALGQQWSRLCAAQAAREGVRFASGSLDFASGVMAALDDLPEAQGTRVVDFRPRAAAEPAAKRSVWRPAYGLAAAASIAAVAVLTAVSTHRSADLGAASISVPVAKVDFSSSTAGGQFVPVVLKSGDANGMGLKETGWSQLDPDSARLFDDYVIEHSNYRVVPGMTGSLGYARFAAHSADLRTADGPH